MRMGFDKIFPRAGCSHDLIQASGILTVIMKTNIGMSEIHHRGALAFCLHLEVAKAGISCKNVQGNGLKEFLETTFKHLCSSI